MTGRVVIAEHELELAYAIGHLIEQDGYDVTVFTSATAAWDDIEAHSTLRLLLTDIKFPSEQPNGFMLAQHARMHHRGVQVIFMTRYPDAAKLISLKRDGPLMMKPCDADVPMMYVRELVPLTKAV